MQRLTITHVTRWQRNYDRVGYGHMYQGRFKSFPVETNDYFCQVMRYVERNALRANLVSRAEDWQWGSQWIRQFGSAGHRAMLSDWPMPQPRQWVHYVNEPATDAELQAIRRSCHRGSPCGSGNGSGEQQRNWGWSQRYGHLDDQSYHETGPVPVSPVSPRLCRFLERIAHRVLGERHSCGQQSWHSHSVIFRNWQPRCELSGRVAIHITAIRRDRDCPRPIRWRPSGPRS